MKKIIYILISLFILMPSIVYAETQAKDLRETVEEAGLTFKATDYQETSDQVTLYLFHRATCNHCHDEITWLNEITEEHGSKFKLRSFELSYNPDNNALYHQIIEYLNLKEGVPLLIIGKEEFRGFGDSTGDKILAKIESAYKDKDDYDIFDAMEKYSSRSEEPKQPNEKPSPVTAQSGENENNIDVPKIIMIVAGIGIVIAVIVLIITIKKRR